MSNNKEKKDNSDNLDLVYALIKKYNKKQPDTPIKNISIDIKTEKNVYKLIRLNDEQFYLLHQNSISISEDYGQIMDLSMDNDLIYSSFSKMYVTLKELFGVSSKYYDDWKSSFSFPFLIYFQNGEEEFGYLMNLHNFRSNIEFRIAKLIPADDEKFERGIAYNPFEEFPRHEIHYLINYFTGFLSGYFKTIEKQYDEFFFKIAQSNHILFGYKEGQYFDSYYQNEEEFESAIQDLKKVEISSSEINPTC